MRQLKRLPDFVVKFHRLRAEVGIPPGKYFVSREACYTLGKSLGSVFRLVSFDDPSVEFHLYLDKADEIISSREDFLRTKLYISEPDLDRSQISLFEKQEKEPGKGRFLTEFENTSPSLWKKIRFSWGKEVFPSSLEEAAWYLGGEIVVV